MIVIQEVSTIRAATVLELPAQLVHRAQGGAFAAARHSDPGAY